MNRFLKNFLIIALILLGIVLLTQGANFTNKATKTKTLELNELIGLVQNEQISKITIKDSDIVAITKDNQRIISKADQKGSFFETLKYYNIDSSKLKGIKIDFATSVD